MPRKKNATVKANATKAKKASENMKYEIANEFGVNLGANASSHDNGMVGGEMTKRLVANGKNKKKTNSKKKK